MNLTATETVYDIVRVVSTKQDVNKQLRELFPQKVNTPKDAAEIFRKAIGEQDREHFIVLSLNTKNQVNRIEIISIGSLNSAIVHPREVFKSAILANAASIIVGHQHPSGDTTPSREDIEVTKRLKAAGNLLGIELLDHIIVTDSDKYHSLKENGSL